MILMASIVIFCGLLFVGEGLDRVAKAIKEKKRG
jgi:hypothetical protein